MLLKPIPYIERLSAKWVATVYAFYKPDVTIVHKDDGARGHGFRCAKPGCKTTITRWLNTGDATSTGNLWRHTERCWGAEIVAEAKKAADAKDARPMVEKYGRTGTISHFFKRLGKGKVTYSIRQHTFTETRYAAHSYLLDFGFDLLTARVAQRSCAGSPRTSGRLRSSKTAHS